MDAATRITRQRIKLILKQPFFGTLAMHLEPVKVNPDDPLIRTAATDGRHLYYNPEWIKTLDDEEVRGIIMHEVLHCALDHFRRCGTRMQEAWNIAIDYATNAIIKSNQVRLPMGVLYNEDYKDKCAEEIYDDLLKNAIPLSKLSTLDQHPDGKPVLVYDDEDGDGQPGGGGMPTGKSPKSGTPNPLAGSRAPPYKPGPNDWKTILARATESSKMQGTMPAGMDRFIDEILNPRIPWRQMLAEFIINMNKSDYDMRRPNKRYIGAGIYFPSLRGENIEIAIAIDTSGSIGDNDLKQFVAEINGIMTQIKGWRLHVIGCDAAVHGYEIVEYPNDLDFRQVLKGRGGTSFIPVFDKIREEGIRPSCLVYLTDSYGSFPDEQPEYPVLWIINNNEGKVPWGREARLSDV